MESPGNPREITAKAQVVGLFVRGQNAEYGGLGIVVENGVAHESKAEGIAIPLTRFHYVVCVQRNVVDLPRSNAPADIPLRAIRIRRFQVSGCVKAVDLPEDFMKVSPWAAKSVCTAVPNRFIPPFAADAAGFDPRGCLAEVVRTIAAPRRVTEAGLIRCC